jgi:hypothetical protein
MLLHPGRSSFEAPGTMLRIAPLAPQDDGFGASLRCGERMSPHIVIASEAKQSRIFPRRDSGLLRRKGSSQ